MKIRTAGVCLVSLLAAFLAVSHDSLWIDEAYSAHFAVAPDLATWWHRMKAEGPPDIEMPLYMFFLWIWEKAFGPSEWALRAANIPWFLLSQAAFWIGFRRWPKLQLAAVLCGAFNPMLWRYLNEARPYAMEYSGAAIVICCLAALASPTAKIGALWLYAFSAGLLILCSSCALGIPWAGAAVLALLCLAWRRARVDWNTASLAAGAAGTAALIALAAYYFSVRHYGSGGEVGFGHRLETLCFVLYEILGFAGLGPGRIQITTQPEPSIFFPFLGFLLPAALLMAGIFAIAGQAVRRCVDSRVILAAASYLLLPCLFLIGMIYKMDWHAVGRHFMAASPVAVLVVALAVAWAWQQKRRGQICWTGALCLFWIISCMQMRFAERHQRDDYRDAAPLALAALAQGKRVWWVAAELAGGYYGVPLTSDAAEKGRALVLWRPTAKEITKLPPPELVFFSKPTVFDRTGLIGTYLRSRNYSVAGTLPAFSILESKPGR